MYQDHQDENDVYRLREHHVKLADVSHNGDPHEDARNERHGRCQHRKIVGRPHCVRRQHYQTIGRALYAVLDRGHLADNILVVHVLSPGPPGSPTVLKLVHCYQKPHHSAVQQHDIRDNDRYSLARFLTQDQLSGVFCSHGAYRGYLEYRAHQSYGRYLFRNLKFSIFQSIKNKQRVCCLVLTHLK